MSAIGSSSFGGGSGLDIPSLVEALVANSSGPKLRLESQRRLNQTRLSAMKDVASKVSALETALSGLSKASTFLRKTATVADGAGFAVSVNGSARDGGHAVRVSQLAASERETSQGFADRDLTSVGTGSFSVTVAGVQTSIDIVAGQDTLEGIRDAINASDAKVTASIVNKGTGADPYQLVVTGDETGVDQTISIDASGLAGGAGLSFTQDRAAANAQFQVDGVSLERATNTVTDVLDGVSLRLQVADDTERTFSVAIDAVSTTKQITDFVTAYNGVMDAVNAQFTRSGEDASSKPLAGDFSLRLVQRRLQSALGLAFGRPGASLRSLSAIGLKTSSDGLKLELDSDVIAKALEESPSDVVDLFVKSGSGPDSTTRVRSVGTTAAGTYDVTVTQAAARAETVGAQAIDAGGLAADEVLSFTQGAASVDITLNAGSTVTDIVSTLNAELATAGIDVLAVDDGGSLRLQAKEYGSAADFTVQSDQAGGSSAQTGIGTSLVSATGLDVQGTIAGAAATGTGLRLVGATDGPTPGLIVDIYGTATGSRGDVTIFGGFAGEVASIADALTDPVDGILKLREEGIEDAIDDLDDRIERQEDHLAVLEARYTKQFTGLESLLTTLNSQAGFLSASLLSLPGTNR